MLRHNNNPNEKEIYIIYSNELGNIDPNDLQLCELFINKLYLSSKEIVNFKVNNALNFIESNDLKIKEILTLILKTKQMQSFYSLFKKLLHCTSKNYLGRLELVINKKKLYYSFKEYESFPNFKWEIKKLESMICDE